MTEKQTVFQVYDSNGAALGNQTTDLHRAEAMARTARNTFPPGFVLVLGRNDWARRLDNDGARAELTATQIPENIRRANAR